MHVVVSEMTNRERPPREHRRQPASRSPTKEARLLEEHRQATAHLYCHGCGHLCETAARGVPVATVLRYLRYYEVYGKRQQARALYQALPPRPATSPTPTSTPPRPPAPTACPSPTWSSRPTAGMRLTAGRSVETDRPGATTIAPAVARDPVEPSVASSSLVRAAVLGRRVGTSGPGIA